MSFNNADWLDFNKLLVPKFGPASQLMPIFFNSYTGAGGASGIWNTVDVSNDVHESTVAIHLTGMLIITHGTTAETADLRIHFRQDSAQPGSYIHQVIETSVTSGQRSTMACWIPLTSEKKFDWKWETQYPPGIYPSYSAFGGNLQIDAIGLHS